MSGFNGQLKCFFLLSPILGYVLNDQGTNLTYLTINTSLYGPLTETKEQGNWIFLEYYIVVPVEKCCLGLIMTDKPLLSVFTTHECYDIDRSVLDDVYEIGRGSLVKLDWRFQHWRDEPDDEGKGCFLDNTGSQNYTCYGTLTNFYPRFVRGHVYIFYPCFVNQSIEAFYQVSMYAKNRTDAKDETGCTRLASDSICSKYYSYKSIPNHRGDKSIFEAYAGFSTASAMIESKCHQHIEEFICSIFLPQCSPKGVIAPCRSMCLEVMEACKEQADKLQNGLVKGKITFEVLRDYYCDGFPENDQCFRKNVSCGTPPEIRKGQHNFKSNYSKVNSTSTYRCNGDFTLEENASVVCQYSGKWSKPPRCKAIKSNKTILMILLICSSILIFIIISMLLVYKYRRDVEALLYFKWGVVLQKQKEEERKYDAFIAYSQEDIHFVQRSLLEPLQKMEPPFQICVRDRDFDSGDWKSQNIIRSVQQSRRTIIVLSQNFINSQWCQFEFAQAHLRLLEDQSFKLLVIALENPATLRGVPELIQNYIQTRTYLSKDDRLFWEKLIYQMPRRT